MSRQWTGVLDERLMKNWRKIVILAVGVIFIVVLPVFAKGFIFRPDPTTQIVKDKIGNQKEQSKFVEHQIIVKFKPNKISLKTKRGVQQATDFAKKKKLQTLRLIKTGNIVVLQDITKSTSALVDELKKDISVESVQPNYQYYLRTIDPSYDQLWGLHNSGQTVNGVSGTVDADIKAPEAWSVSTGNNFTVAIIDSGVAYNHPDLKNSLWDGSSCLDSNGNPLGGCNAGYDFEDNDPSPLPTSSSHGTHVAGIIAAESNNSIGVAGVAPHAKIMALKSSLTTDQIVRAIQFAQVNGARIINASWGGPSYDPTMKAAIDSYDGLFITAAGNSSANHDVDTANYPCNYDSSNIICVAATDQNDNLSSFSDYGTKDVDVGAPGSNIYNTWAATDVLNESFDGVTPPNIPTGYSKTGDWGTHSFGVGNNVLYGDVSHYPYLSNANSTLTSPSIDLSNAMGATIGFITVCDTEYSTGSWTDYMSFETKKLQFHEAPPTWSLEWGKYGVENGKFDYARGIAVNSHGDVYVSDYNKNRIQIFDQNGIYQSKFGNWGNGNGQFVNPGAVVIDKNDFVYVLDNEYPRVQKFTPDGVFLTQYGEPGTGMGQIGTPSDLAVDDNGNVFISEINENWRIQKFANDGTYVTQWGFRGSNSGQFYTTKLAISPSGSVVVGDPDNHRIQVFDNDGIYQYEFGESEAGLYQEFSNIWDINIDELGQLNVLDQVQKRVRRYSLYGDFNSELELRGGWGVSYNSLSSGNRSLYLTKFGGDYEVEKYVYPEIPPELTEVFKEYLRWDEPYLDTDTNPFGSSVSYLSLSIPQESLIGNAQFQYRWVTNSNSDAGGGDGCFVDDINITKFNDGSLNQYEYLDGTSMATPFVVGEAVMLWSIKPSMSASEVKDVILNSGDTIPALQGKISTGKRINLFGAVKELSKARLSQLPNSITNQTSANIGVGGYDVDSYRYSIDESTFSTETSVSNPIVLTGLSEGDHAIRVLGKGGTGYWQIVTEATSYTWKVDSAAPTATISYSTTATTNQDVIATLEPSEPVTVTNNDGSRTKTFTENGSFTFTFVDQVGNNGSTTATVSNIDKTPPSPPPPVVTPEVPSVTPVVVPPLPLLVTEPTPTITPGKVLGVTTTRPILKSLKFTNGAYSYKLNGKKITFRPFGTSYKGAVWTRSVDFGPDGKIYVFINSGSYSKGQIRVYKADGKLFKAYNPYGGFATNGLNATAVVEYDDNVYLSVGTAKAGTTVKSYQVTANGLQTLKSITVTKTQGNVLVGFQKLYKNQYGLVTMRQNSRSTLKVWKLDFKTNKFIEDKKIKKSKIRI